MLRNLFKRQPRLDAPESTERLAALTALADEAQDDFERLAGSDPDRGVRVAAVGRLTRLPPLVSLLDDEALAGDAAERLLSLRGEGMPAAVREHPAVLRAAVVCADTAAAAAQAAQSIQDAGERAAAILAHPRASVRLAVAETTWQPAALAALERAARGADSATHRLARERAAEYRAALAERDEQDAKADELLSAANALGEPDPHYAARHGALERKWRDNLTAIGATDGALGRFGVVARDVEALRLRFPSRRAPREAPQVSAEAWTELLAQAEALPAAAAKATASADSFETVVERASAVRTEADAIAAKWNALADVQQPDDALSQRFRAAEAEVSTRMRPLERAAALAEDAAKVLRANTPAAEDLAPNDAASSAQTTRDLKRASTAIERLITRYDWPPEVAEPVPLKALRERREALLQAAARCEERTAELADQVEAELEKLRHCVDTGAAKQAAAHDRRVRDLVRHLPQQQARAFNTQLAEVGAAVRELREWRLYAEAPKREALCQEMEALAENPLPVNAQTEAVRAVRERWKALGGAEMRRERALAKRFEAAAEQAFAPCRAHFKEQAERRAFNLQQRRAIVAALEHYLENNDWDHADWRGVERVLRQARNEWRSYHPVDRKADREIKARFETLAGRLHGLLKEAWDRHLQVKEDLVAQAAKVRESGDQASAKADAMKALQRRWKQAGPVPRAADQKLWKRFRAECDAVFEARSAAMGRHLERRAAIDEAESLINELERRMDLDAALDRNGVADYQRRLDALGALPKELRRRAETAIADADRAVVENQRGR